MSVTQRLREIRKGFQTAFWVANITEMFERLSYYGVQAVLAIYLHERLQFSEATTGDLIGYFGFIVWFLPILGGALADRFGFRRSLAFAYFVLSLGYFLLGSLHTAWMAPLRNALPLEQLVLLILLVPALGPAIVKPCVVGTTARASTENVRSLGYSIYYTLVNVGSTLGPLVAFAVRRSIGIENVFRVCAASVLLMFFATLIWFREPKQAGEQQVASVAAALKNMLVIIGRYKPFLALCGVAVLVKIVSWVAGFAVPVWFWIALLALSLGCLSRFMWFLVIFSGFWVVFWQEFISLPLFIRDANRRADVDLLLTVDPLAVIIFQILISYATRKIPDFLAITAGLLIASLSWLFLAAGNLGWQINTTLRLGSWSLPIQGLPVLAIVALFVLAVGEMTQSPRYYEYVSRLAPSGQQGTYMGYAFLPIGIGFLIAGAMGGRLVEYYRDVVQKPQQMWYVITAAGVFATVLMLIYDRVVKPGRAESSAK